MRVTIIGPNLYDQSKGQFHVHAENCADIARDPRRYGYQQAGPHMAADVESWEQVAAFVFGDHMAEADPGSQWTEASAYLPEFHFAPCVHLRH